MTKSVPSGKWYGVPVLVFLIGILSIVLLLGVNRNYQRQLANSARVEATSQIQINAVTFHLFQEEYVGGNHSADIADGVKVIDQAIGLIDFIMNADNDKQSAGPATPEDREVHDRVRELRRLLLLYRTFGLECLQNPASSGIGTDADQRFHAAYLVILDEAAALEKILQSHSQKYQSASRKLFLTVLTIWSAVVVSASAGLWVMERRRKAADQALLDANTILVSQANELQAHREHLEDLVDKRTADVMAANQQLVLEIAERLQTEASLKESGSQIRHLSAQLLRAQEIERRRISLELHDELGQALTVTKLRLRAIENDLKPDQQSLREDCEHLLIYLDDTIENVRRLSLAISPTVLEDLGLTSALQRLMDTIAKIPSLQVTTAIDDIDCCIQQSHWITVYRVVQEALTNIGKHAHATHIAVTIKRHDASVLFSIEDDGQGFEPGRASSKTAAGKGLGLSTMDERVRMMGGSFESWSSRGMGTRIVFSIPVGREGAHDEQL